MTRRRRGVVAALLGMEDMDMHTPNDDAIRDRAYSLWVEAGSPEGDGMDYWLAAEQELGSHDDTPAPEGEMSQSEPETSQEPTQY